MPTPRPSLWIRLDCKNGDKTRDYIECSKFLPLEICLEQVQVMWVIFDAL